MESIGDPTAHNFRRSPTLEGAARSLKQAGFTHIVLIGDHGGYQKDLRDVAASLNREWSGTKTRAHFIDVYYKVTETLYVQALRAKGVIGEGLAG